jgi:hypothetical protein
MRRAARSILAAAAVVGRQDGRDAACNAARVRYGRNGSVEPGLIE